MNKRRLHDLPVATAAADVVDTVVMVTIVVQSLRGSPCAKNVREVSLHFHELDHVAQQKSEGRLFVTRQ